MGEYQAQVGETVEVGAVIATIEDSQQAGETTEVKEREKPQPAEQAPASARAPAAEEEDHTTTLSPAVRRAVLEQWSIRARSGHRQGRPLTKEDVLAAARPRRPGARRSRPRPPPRPGASRPASPTASGARSGSR
jgi:2-oxoglutarate dehydrogenase E2 component (dihydrolipoamide succinyltransferase)